MRRLWIIAALVLVLVVGGVVLFVSPALRHSDEVPSTNILPQGRTEGLRALEVTTAKGDLIWAIEKGIGASVDGVAYAELPRGFVQRYPARGTPRELVPKELLMISATFESNSFLHISSRFVGKVGFLHGLTVSGSRCPDPGCTEKLRLRPLLEVEGTHANQ